MFSTAKSIYTEVKGELPLGSGNLQDDNVILDKTILINVLNNSFLEEFYMAALKNKVCTFQEFLVLNQMIRAVLAKAVQCGACVDHAAAVFVKSLELEVSQPKEIVEIKGKQKLKGVLIGFRDSKPIYQGFASHSLTIFNRDSKNTDLNQISTWKGITVVDTWGAGQIQEYKQTEHPNDVDLVSGLFKPDEVFSICRIENILRPDEWSKYAMLLSQARDYINAHFNLWFENDDHIEPAFKKWFARITDKTNQIDLATVLSNINEAFNLKIAMYQEFGARQLKQLAENKKQSSFCCFLRRDKVKKTAEAKNLEEPLAQSMSDDRATHIKIRAH